MTRYNDPEENIFEDEMQRQGYREGVDRVMIYIQSIHSYRKLEDEIEWAIKEGII